VSFAPPAGWVRVTTPASAAGTEHVCFRERAGDLRSSVLCIRRVRARGTRSVQEICRDAIWWYFADHLGRADTILLLRQIEYEQAALGPFQGIRAVLAETGDVFVVAEVGANPAHTEAYILEYHRDGALEPPDLTVCDTVARSFKQH